MYLCLDGADISFRNIGQRFDVEEMILMFLTSLRQYFVGKTEDGGTYILDGNSEIDAHVWSNLCYLIC